MTEIQKRLFSLSDNEYADFQAKLAPSIARKTCIGVRIPVLRDFAKTLTEDEKTEFLSALPHEYYDENMLHSILLAKEKNFEKCLYETERFLPYIDNWASCDTLRPKCFAKHKKEILEKINVWVNSKNTYTCRFGVDTLMELFLDEDFKPEYLAIPAKIKSEEYYVNMMIAWFYATALAKKWDFTIPYLEKKTLSEFVHKKTIQKAIESYRISDAQKEYLKKLRDI